VVCGKRLIGGTNPIYKEGALASPEECMVEPRLVQKHSLKSQDIGSPAEAFMEFVSVAGERRYHKLSVDVIRVESSG